MTANLTRAAAAATAQVAVADADLAFAKADLDRNKRLLDPKFISQAAYDNKLSAYRVAVARRDSARAQSEVSGNQAGYTTLVADSAGLITSVLAEAGQVVAAGQAVMKLARTEGRDVAISVAENQASPHCACNSRQATLLKRVAPWRNPRREARPLRRGSVCAGPMRPASESQSGI